MSDNEIERCAAEMVKAWGDDLAWWMRELERLVAAESRPAFDLGRLLREWRPAWVTDLERDAAVRCAALTVH